MDREPKPVLTAETIRHTYMRAEREAVADGETPAHARLYALSAVSALRTQASNRAKRAAS